MATDLADRHPPRIHRDNLVVEIREPTLVVAITFESNVLARSRGTDSVIFEMPV